MPLNFYYDFMSQPARACYILLKCANIPFQSHLIDLKKSKIVFNEVWCICNVILGQHLTDEYSKINYFRKVPVIDDNGFRLSERLYLQI